MPKDSLERGKDLLGSIKITNQDFCTEMILRPEDHHLVLPWWYNYCQDIRNKYPNGIQGTVDVEAVRKYIMSEVELYRQRMHEKNIRFSDLEKELIDYNLANNL